MAHSPRRYNEPMPYSETYIRIRKRPHVLCHALALALSVAFALGLALSQNSGVAWADALSTNDDPDELQEEVERTSQAYEQAKASTDDITRQVQENQQKLDSLAAQVEDQRQASTKAAAELYKLQRQPISVINFVLSADSIEDVMRNVDYMNNATQADWKKLNQLAETQRAYQQTQDLLEAQRQEAVENQEAAASALQEAQDARERAQQEAQQRAIQNAASQGLSAVSADGADWSMSAEEFIDTWTKRIDAYLAGSPLAGQGRNFAKAAWKYGVDPRWSPAISNTESSKGRHCFLPYNAWGWGQSAFGSWDAAIDAHVKGLARGYGYTITVSAAQKYCPPNWDNWYKNTCAQMESI